MMGAPNCLHCDKPAKLTNGMHVYPHRKDLHHKPIWKCDDCNAICGCHPGTEVALGRPANKETRAARMLVHDRLDPLWRQFKGRKRRARNAVYDILAEYMGLTREQTHTALFSIQQCRQAWKCLGMVTYDQIAARMH